MPSPSYWPILLSAALPVLAYGVIYSTILIVVGAALVILGIFGWALEPSVADDSDYDPPSAPGSSMEVAVSG
jgi:cytochrome c oxidase subunit 1